MDPPPAPLAAGLIPPRAPVAVGSAYRVGLDDWIRSPHTRLGCVEVRAADFYKTGRGRLRQLAGLGPLLVRSDRLSLASPGPLPPGEVAWLAAVVETAEPWWVSEPVGFRRTAEVELPAVCPVRADAGTLERVADHAREAAARCGRPLLLENLAAPLRIPGSLAETELLNRLCERVDCGLLLDLAALFANAGNHGFDPGRWLEELDPARVTGLRVGPCATRAGRRLAGRGTRVPDAVWQLVRECLARFRPRALVLAHEWDLPHPAEAQAGLDRLRALAAQASGSPGAGGPGPA